MPVEKTVVVPQERVTVRLSGWAANPQETALLESLLYRFSLENPDIVVKYEPITGDYWQAIKTLVGAGEEPDIYYMDIFQFPFFAKEGVLLPLDDLMASTGTSRDVFIPDLINAFTYEGKTYGIPKDFNTLALFYNKDLFDQAGLAYPTDDWTWDDLKAAAQKLSQPDKNIYGLGVPADPGRFPIFVFQNGGRIMTEDFSDTLLDSPEVVEAARFYYVAAHRPALAGEVHAPHRAPVVQGRILHPLLHRPGGFHFQQPADHPDLPFPLPALLHPQRRGKLRSSARQASHRMACPARRAASASGSRAP